MFFNNAGKKVRYLKTTDKDAGLIEFLSYARSGLLRVVSADKPETIVEEHYFDRGRRYREVKTENGKRIVRLFSPDMALPEDDGLVAVMEFAGDGPFMVSAAVPPNVRGPENRIYIHGFMSHDDNMKSWMSVIAGAGSMSSRAEFNMRITAEAEAYNDITSALESMGPDMVKLGRVVGGIVRSARTDKYRMSRALSSLGPSAIDRAVIEQAARERLVRS